MGRLHKYLRENKIKVDGKKQPLSFRLMPGMQVRLYAPECELSENVGPAFLRAREALSVVYEDAQLLVADKPAGLPVCGEEEQPDTLENRVRLYLYRRGEWMPDSGFAPSLCHRLDTGTSGLVLLAKTEAAHKAALELIRTRAVEKRYLCVTFGRPHPPAGTLGGYLLKDAAAGHVRIVQQSRPGAKEVVTRYRTVAVSGRLALLEVELVTGRTHQIRAHMAEIGCPILGDSKYGNNSVNRALHMKYQALCAWSLHFPTLPSTHPCAGLSDQTLYAPQPWYAQQVLDGTLQ
jgi:23S rRNA pseudouridine955/2504/2580 synthase